jgi:hypothetical protein
MFAFGEGAAKRTLAGVIFGVGMAVGAVNFMSWLFPSQYPVRCSPNYAQEFRRRYPGRGSIQDSGFEIQGHGRQEPNPGTEAS